MKISTLLLTTLMLLLLLNPLKAQQRIQTVENGISQIGLSKSTMSNYLSDHGFSYINSSGSLFHYVKTVPFGSNDFMVSYKDQHVNSVAWTEHIANINNALSEIKSGGFKNDKLSTGTNIYSFENYAKNVMLTLIVREEINDFQLTIGKLNPGLSKKTQSPKTIIKSENPSPHVKRFVAQIPKAPIDINKESSNKNDPTSLDKFPDVNY